MLRIAYRPCGAWSGSSPSGIRRDFGSRRTRRRRTRQQRPEAPSEAPGLAFLEQHCPENDRALEYELHVAVDVVELKDVAEEAEDEHPNERAGHEAFTTHKTRPPNHHGGDRVQFDARSRIGLALLILGGVKNAGEAR